MLDVRMSTLGRAVGVLAVSILAGFALAIALLGTTERYGGPVGGEWWIPLFAATSAALGGIAARTLPVTWALAVSALAPPLAILTLIAIKVLRWPMWPAMSGGFEILLAFSAGVGVAAMLIARATGRSNLPAPLRGYVTLGVLVLTSIGATLAILQLARFVGS